MAKVSLRVYNREIGTLIDQGQVEEAVGHCNHILKTFPKHLETYQLLGKAYLEAKRYKDASDVFSRLLLSVPDDFVAHVGMSLIADETEQLDDAIWHMQRAFEAQPSNAAVQNELQRLYGRRDGVQPPKIRMTSGALANVYVQGELYPQAIAEIMSVEAQDPGRMEMQVLLARAYFRSGQRVEASKIASDLLAKSPYCLDANRILVEILPETSRAESTQVYRHRVNALDPYAAFAKASTFNTSDVPDAAVSLERLDWQPGDTTFADEISASGIQLDREGAEEQPDWLKEGANAEFGSATASETAAPVENDIPDFMKAAGWGTSSGAEEPTSFFDGPDIPEATNGDDEPIAQAELPDWMKNIAPDQAELEAANKFTDDMGDDAMADDWINDLLGDSNDEETHQTQSSSDAGIGNLGTSSEEQDAAMNWLESLAANQGAKPEELITDPNARTESAPDWVQKAANAGANASATPQAEEEVFGATDDSDDMAWLNELGGEETDAPTEQSIPAAEENDLAWLNDFSDDGTPASAAGSADDVPEWLRETRETPATPEPATASTGEDMAWLNELGEEAPAATEQPTPASEENDMAWLNDLASEPEEEVPVSVEDAPPAPATSAGAIADATIGTLGTSSDDQDAAMNWLESLAANQGAKPEELITDPNARTEDAPEWVQKAQDVSQSVHPAAEPPVQEEAPTDENIPVAEPAVESINESTVEDEEEDWLAEQAEVRLAHDAPTPIPTASEEPQLPPVQEEAAQFPVQQEPIEASTPQEVEVPVDDMPDWLKEEEEQAPSPTIVPSAPVVETPAAPAQKKEDLPGWLADMENADKESKPVSAGDDLPDWLKTEEAPAKPEAQPTKAEEWKPITPKAEEQPVQPERKPKPPLDLPPRRNVQRMNTTMLRDITLMSAQAAMREGNVSAALAEYGKMIKKKRLLDETIYDLREALYEYPVDVSIWQMLGDAYMRAGRLQEAINAYTKAEELLR